MTDTSPEIVIAGASGYIGKALIPELLEKFPTAKITALSRSKQQSEDPRVSWDACDLFSLKSLEAALPKKIDLAFYLVHSMGPTAHLDQGSFADYDLILADNFARAIKTTNVKQVIYLGGLIPESKELSLHLQSRLEVEETFTEHRLPLTIFRAGLILGEGGSSFQILLKLVERLPVMICPRWTQTLTTPVDLATVLSSLASAALDTKCFGKIYDLSGCRPLTYLDMMKETARKMNRKKIFIRVPFFSPTVSRLWVSLVTNTSRTLVYPLVESLEHSMVARSDHLFSSECLSQNYFELLGKASLKTHPGRFFFQFQAQRKTVRSVQRLTLPTGKDAEWVKTHYAEWLPKFLSPLIRVSQIENTVTFSIFASRFVLLELELSQHRSHSDRQLLYIKKGLLVGEKNKGRLEFRVVLGRKFTLAAIHDYKPALPWFIYIHTQAKIHLFVMKAFGKNLVSLPSNNK